jgi:hypothetical protein
MELDELEDLKFENKYIGYILQSNLIDWSVDEDSNGNYDKSFKILKVAENISDRRNKYNKNSINVNVFNIWCSRINDKIDKKYGINNHKYCKHCGGRID